VAGVLLVAGAAAGAHGSRAGDILIEHPYALPSLPHSTGSAAYVRSLRNDGELPDRLLGASTPAAAAVEIRHAELDVANVMHMQVAHSVPLPARRELKLMHGGPWHLMLLDLKAPLKDGDRFPLTLHFERGGQAVVTVWVQRPRDRSGTPIQHD
jgi:copper(I)-binding protein